MKVPDQELLACDYVFPVFGASTGRTETEVKELCGTAFPIGPGIFVTAGHVLRNALTHKTAAIGFGTEGRSSSWIGSPIRDTEFLDHDMGLCRAAVPPSARVMSLVWEDRAPEPLRTAVGALGYPYGLDIESNMIIVRAFRGHIVCERFQKQLPGSPRVYELSFPCPRGLSGAPLWLDDDALVVGVVVGNHITEMEVYSETEVEKETGRETVFRKTEALHLGLAVTSQAILGLRSTMLKGTVKEWLSQEGLLRSQQSEETEMHGGNG